VDVAVGDDLRAGVDRREHDEIVVLRVDDLAAADGLRDDDRTAVGGRTRRRMVAGDVHVAGRCPVRLGQGRLVLRALDASRRGRLRLQDAETRGDGRGRSPSGMFDTPTGTSRQSLSTWTSSAKGSAAASSPSSPRSSSTARR